jgi:hypothetical protein
MRNTPSTPENAFVRPSASVIDAIAISQPFSAHGRPLSTLRTTALTGRPAASRVRATMPPTLPVIPVTAYMICLLPTIRKVVEHAKEAARAGRQTVNQRTAQISSSGASTDYLCLVPSHSSAG